mgnify:CR=1
MLLRARIAVVAGGFTVVEAPIAASVANGAS